MKTNLSQPLRSLEWMYLGLSRSLIQYNNGNGDYLQTLIDRCGKRISFWGVFAFGVVSFYVLLPSLVPLGINNRNDMFSGSKRNDKFTTGLINNRNDCFANSSVQALAGLPKLTLYLNDFLKQIQFLRTLLEQNDTRNGDAIDGDETPAGAETPESNDEHENATPDGTEHYGVQPHLVRPSLQALAKESGDASFSSTATITVLSQAGHHEEVRSGQQEEGPAISQASSDDIPEVPTHEGLSQILYQLQQLVSSNTYISVWPFLHVLELIFDAKISTGQNDAHELTQVILETLEKENVRVRKFIKDQSLNVIVPDFPIRGSLADHLICLQCQDSSKVNTHPFTMYPIVVPQEMTANLAEMIAENQTETIEGYSCLCCKIKAIVANERQRNYQGNTDEENNIVKTLERVIPEVFINDDLSENLMQYINDYNKDGCDSSAIKSRIVKKTVVVDSPELLILHLSRSVFNGMSYTRNSCNVLFDEILTTHEQTIKDNRSVGMTTVKYKLKSVIKHQGTHSQGHYECYRHKPDILKDALSGQIVNRSPIIDFGMDSNRAAAFAWKESANSAMSDASSISSQESENSTSNPFRTVFPESDNKTPLNSAVVDGDDYVIGSTDSLPSNEPSRKPSKLKRFAGFLSRRSSVASNNDNSSSATGSEPTKKPARSRVNSIASLHMARSESQDSSVGVSSSGLDLTEYSASEDDAGGSNIKRKLKKIKSVIKFPYWKISDAIVKEAKSSDVLSDTKYVYMLYYERVDEENA
ncbi:LAMI_0E07140g1_1 [Lachancea mirantina]|uniref:LAMI_0E07140g1_1 n=1 Tax=Lachancea mirantina TaxID=1230905 RepID=A0A1G4JMI7_9SACH|nr:LAMI_0E07140g1_1 [Lachancea mirantina]